MPPRCARRECARIEQYAARLYPRYRDVQTALYESLNDLHLLDITDQIGAPHEAQSNLRDRIKTQNLAKYETNYEVKHHIRGVMRSLLRKHGTFWKAAEDFWQGIGPAARAEGDGLLKKYYNVWLCMPVCQLGILQRLDHACSGGDIRGSLRQCHTLVERICHWLHMSNRLMNKVELVCRHELIRD